MTTTTSMQAFSAEEERIRGAILTLGAAVAGTGSRVLAGLGGGEAHALDLPGEELTDRLLCWTAPPEVEAVVAVWEEESRIRGYGASRTGTSATVGPGGGSKLEDYTRRSLGLATPPPSAPRGSITVKIWLAGLLALTDETEPSGGSNLSWADVTKLNPFLNHNHPNSNSNGSSGAATPETAARLIMSGTAEMDWASFRVDVGELLARDGNPEMCYGMTLPMLEWMDDGAMSRHVMDATAPVVLLLLRLGLSRRLTETAYANLVATVRILRSRWSDGW